MASLEAKILGERAENYCSSDEGEHDEDVEDKDDGPSSGPKDQPGIPKLPPKKWEGYSQNTGPKGVLKDWELYKEYEKQMRIAKETELIKMVQKSSLSCRTVDEDQQAEQRREQFQKQLESEDLDELLSDKVLEEFIQKRMETLAQRVQIPVTSQGLMDVKSGDQFLQVVDETDKRIPVIIHIYDDKLPECDKMNSCLSDLAELYPHVQFCKMRAEAVGMSLSFRLKGVPALLVYREGSLIGNFVQMRDEFGQEFYTGDVENFLIENGMIEDRANVPRLLAQMKAKVNN